MSFYSVPDLG